MARKLYNRAMEARGLGGKWCWKTENHTVRGGRSQRLADSVQSIVYALGTHGNNTLK